MSPYYHNYTYSVNGYLTTSEFDSFYSKNYYLDMEHINTPEQEAELRRVRIQKAEELLREAQEMLTQNLNAEEKGLWEARRKTRQEVLDRLQDVQEEVAA